MEITDKTRKILWARSGNRCAICRHELTMKIVPNAELSIIGEECHIISSKSNGPRYEKLSTIDQYDRIDNLILLCRNHHKLIDDKVEVYSVNVVRDIKAKHENWVEQTIMQGLAREARIHVRFLQRVKNGTQLAGLIGGSFAYVLDNDHPQNQEEVEAIAAFHQDVSDWGDMWSVLEPSERVRIGVAMNRHLSGLDRIGLWVFASRLKYKVTTIDGAGSVWPTLVVTAVRSTNPGITELGELAAILSPNKV